MRKLWIFVSVLSGRNGCCHQYLVAAFVTGMLIGCCDMLQARWLAVVLVTGMMIGCCVLLQAWWLEDIFGDRWVIYTVGNPSWSTHWPWTRWAVWRQVSLKIFTSSCFLDSSVELGRWKKCIFSNSRRKDFSDGSLKFVFKSVAKNLFILSSICFLSRCLQKKFPREFLDKWTTTDFFLFFISLLLDTLMEYCILWFQCWWESACYILVFCGVSTQSETWSYGQFSRLVLG